MKKLRMPLLIVALLVIVLATYFIFFRKTAAANELIQSVRKGDFEMLVVTSGELRSKSNTSITIPSGLQQVNIYQIKISEMVAEGTTVKKGEFVAGLDNSAFTEKISQQKLEIDKAEAEIRRSKLDTLLELRGLRDEIVNLKYDLRQKLLEKEQSKFEAPAEIKRVELEYEKTERSLKQKEDNYKTKTIQAQTKLEILASGLAMLQGRMDNLVKMMGQLTITAPKSGMVIYEKNWSGQKRGVGSQIEVWNPAIARLPDLTQMEVVTFVNEVDIQKVKVGQQVDISLDAMVEKKLKGYIKTVANIGEEKPGSDAKIFEVVVDILTKDDMLRPAMTASCKILTGKYEQAIQVPLDAIYTSQQISYVYKKEGGKLVKQAVKVHVANEMSALIVNGLKEGDQLYYSLPADTSGLKMLLIDSTKAIIPKQLIQIDSAIIKEMQRSAKENRTVESSGVSITIED